MLLAAQDAETGRGKRSRPEVVEAVINQLRF
jgi:hypothetical protein